MEDKWIIPSYIYSTKDSEKVENVPTKSGKYLVVINGDSEYSEGYCVYSYPAYVTVMDVVVGGDTVKDKELEKWGIGPLTVGGRVVEEGEIEGRGAHDEEWDMVIAWMGPIPPIPKEIK